MHGPERLQCAQRGAATGCWLTAAKHPPKRRATEIPKKTFSIIISTEGGAKGSQRHLVLKNFGTGLPQCLASRPGRPCEFWRLICAGFSIAKQAEGCSAHHKARFAALLLPSECRLLRATGFPGWCHGLAALLRIQIQTAWPHRPQYETMPLQMLPPPLVAVELWHLWRGHPL